ncbi:DUF6602 domain-containing protein [Sorangium cellulosum]|nr:DUF6602 domain-containing protein [Sorangium cellulosum]
MADELTFMRMLRDQLTAQANLLEALTSHPTLVGAGRERAVADMLRGLIPRRYEVLSGTILGQHDDGSPQKEERQLDLMVVDTFDYPTLLRHGDIAVVLPQAVRVIIEVKSDLDTPPDPGSGPSSNNDGATIADNQPKRKKKETFLDAVKQVSRNRLLFSKSTEMQLAPVLTILLSHKSPAGNKTLRGWLERVVKTQGKLLGQLTSLDGSSPGYSQAEQEASLLDGSLLPDIIIADNGAFARKEQSEYKFFIAGDDKGTAPGLVTLASQVLEHLYLDDPVHALARLDPRQASVKKLRDRGNELFKKVIAPDLKPDEKNQALKLAGSSKGGA